MKSRIIPLLAALLLTGCATIEHSSKTKQPLGQPTIVGVGDVVLHITKQRDLENVFGKADLFGRKTNEGFSELRFAGVEKSGEIVLYRKDVRILTNETTMSRTPMLLSSGSANTNIVGNSMRTSYSSTTIAPATDFHVAVPAETIPIRLSVGETKIPMEGYLVEIIKATPNSLEYKVNKY